MNGELVALANPLSSDMDVLRPSLLPGLMHSLRHNVSRKNHDVALFEIGRVFANGMAHRHARNAAWPSPSTGQRALPFWTGDEREAKFDVYDLKGLLEEFLEQFGLRGVTLRPASGKHDAVPGIGHHSPRQKIASANWANCCRRSRRNMICATRCFWRN